VVPLFDAKGRVMGVLDADSPKLARFTADDQELLEGAAAVISRLLYS
jgi:GAF domain-containing protein